MIDWPTFNENYQYFPKAVIVELIDIFTSEFQARLIVLEKNIEDADFTSLKFNAHSYKSFISVYWDLKATDYACQLLALANEQENAGMMEVMAHLKSTSERLSEELTTHRKTLV